MARQFIYHMQGLTKTYPAGKKVLDNIHLSFYPDAKIGVLGVNGSGKSTLLRIMAGIDKDFAGDGWVAEGARVGYLPQEPHLDPDKNVRENVMEGVAGKRAFPRFRRLRRAPQLCAEAGRPLRAPEVQGPAGGACPARLREPRGPVDRRQLLVAGREGAVVP